MVRLVLARDGMKLRSLFFAIPTLVPILAIACSSSEAADEDGMPAGLDESAPEALTSANYTSRSGTLQKADLIKRGKDPNLPRIDFLRPVLQGVLYRGGFSNGDKTHAGLASTTTNFCQQGFSEGRYIDFATAATALGTTQCSGNNSGFDYEKGTSSNTHEVMQSIHDVIKGNKGPMFVHCMWGVHSSGAVSAMALMQFCGWTQAEATSYWNSARNGADCAGGCDNWIATKFRSFSVDPALSITTEEQEAICPH
jgi:hypothetical protein